LEELDGATRGTRRCIEIAMPGDTRLDLLIPLSPTAQRSANAHAEFWHYAPSKAPVPSPSARRPTRPSCKSQPSGNRAGGGGGGGGAGRGRPARQTSTTRPAAGGPPPPPPPHHRTRQGSFPENSTVAVVLADVPLKVISREGVRIERWGVLYGFLIVEQFHQAGGFLIHVFEGNQVVLLAEA
jgi:hypothetical protein